MGREDKMVLEATDKEQNKRLIIQQKEWPFKSYIVDKNLIKVIHKVLV